MLGWQKDNIVRAKVTALLRNEHVDSDFIKDSQVGGWVEAKLVSKTGKSWSIELLNGDTVVVGQRALELASQTPPSTAPISSTVNREEDVVSFASSASEDDADGAEV